MKRLLLCLFLLSCIPYLPVAAADITITSGQQDYYFLTGQPVEIPLMVTNGFPDDVEGTVRFSTDTRLQKTGTVMTSTENRVFSWLVPSGTSFMNLTMSPSQASKEYKARISFYYGSPSVVNSSLPEFFIHIVTDPVLVRNSPELLVSSVMPENGIVPSESSVSIEEQSVSTREQTGFDAAMGLSPAGALPQEDPEAGSGQQRDRETREQDQKEFDLRLWQDPLVCAVNTSLVSGGFSLLAADTQPVRSNNGTFSILYRRGADDRVVVRGLMQDGIVHFVHEAANAGITIDHVLDSDPGFQSAVRTMAVQEFRHSETTANRTLTGAVVNTTFVSTAGRKAFVNATMENGQVGQVTLAYAEETGGMVTVMVIGLAAAVLALSAGWYYRKKNTGRTRVPKTVAAPVHKASGHREIAGQILDKAVLAYARQEYSEAYGLAGRALRFYLSNEYGDHGEVSTEEIVSFLRITGLPATDIEHMLKKCDGVVFARGLPDAESFSSAISGIREIVSQGPEG